jgi:hypothetical protein
VADAQLGDYLRIVDGHLITDDRNDATAPPRQLIERAIVNADARATIVPPVAVARPRRRAMAVYAVPLSSVVRDVWAARDCFFIPPEAHVPNPFGLTFAEAKLDTVCFRWHLELVGGELEVSLSSRTQSDAGDLREDEHAGRNRGAARAPHAGRTRTWERVMRQWPLQRPRLIAQRTCARQPAPERVVSQFEFFWTL